MHKVLFVDDQEEILDLIKKKLKDEQYEQYFANSGKKALEIISENQIDLLITDILMKDMNGLDLIEKVNHINSNMMKIVLSGNAQVSSILEAINEGHIHKYLIKPWKIDDSAKEIIRKTLLEVEKRNFYNLKQSELRAYFRIEDLDYLAKAKEWQIEDSNGYIVAKTSKFEETVKYQTRKLDTLNHELILKYIKEN